MVYLYTINSNNNKGVSYLNTINSTNIRGGVTLTSGYDALPVYPNNTTNCSVVAMPIQELDDPITCTVT